jgi:hypothetical protein
MPRVNLNAGPGSFLTADDLKAAMTDQGRPMIGVRRRYGDEYDNFYVDRAWLPLKRGMPVPSLDYRQSTERKVRNAAVQRAAKSVARKVVQRAKRNMLRQRKSVGTSGFHDIGGSYLGAIGQGVPGVQKPPDLIGMVNDIYDTTVSVKPFAEFVGNHPVLALSFFMLAVGIGAALGGYIGAGGADVIKQKLGV